MWNMKNIASGLMFAFFSAFCAISRLKGATESFYLVGAIIFAIVAIAFLKRARR